MKQLFTLLIIFYSIMTVGQDWVHQGSIWKYSYSEMSGMGYVTYRYEKDTLLSNESCHKLSSTNYSAVALGPTYHYDTSSDALFTYSRNDSVFFYDQIHGAWRATYFFNVHTGDSIVIPNASWFGVDSQLHAVVDTTGFTMIDTFHLRFYRFHLTDSCQMGWYGRGTVIERIGMQDNNITPYWHCVTDDTYYGFCSYEDDSFAIYKPYAHCDELPTGIHDAERDEALKLYPNPASDQVLIDYPYSGEVTQTITTAGGHIVMAGKYSKVTSVASLPDGVYIVTLSGSDHMLRNKLVISR
ncbi:MAG: T9SS type A sorting domain-containing protein [Bacteroidetes bacterium]|nr:T9SS type A sorting domain-containing protein [Bacteroidota bacterium]